MSSLVREVVRALLREMTLNPDKSIYYTAFVLDEDSQSKLASLAPQGWKVNSHHMTIISPVEQGKSFRTPPRWLGADECLKVTKIARNDKIITAFVDTSNFPVPMKGPNFPHVTIAINPELDAKPRDSNDFLLSDFETIDPVDICGSITEIPR